MSLTTESMSPADIAAVTGSNRGTGTWGDNGAWWIIILFLFAFCGGWGNGWGGGGSNGAANNYVLSSDFATLQRMISDAAGSTERKLDSISNGICDFGYTNAQLVNGVQQSLMTQGYETRNAIQGVSAQLASCCCDIREGISGVNYNLATQANGISREIERGFCDTNYHMVTQSNQTLQAIDKVGDRIIDYLVSEKTQTLRDENQALRLAASQQAQNNYIVGALRQPCPVPAYVVPNPNCCYQQSTCGCAG